MNATTSNESSNPRPMKIHRRLGRRSPGWAAVATAAACLATASVLANGGPFIIKYPGGDPAAKGVLARLDPDLKPARESRLQVVKEDLAIRFEPEQFLHLTSAKAGSPHGPLVSVTAEYFITNTTAEAVEVDFGFPILRGIYMHPFAMMPIAEATVRLDGKEQIRPAIISNSAIYGILRQRAAAAIERAIQADPELRLRVEHLRNSSGESRSPARQNLTDYLGRRSRWTPGEILLFVEYIALGPGAASSSQSSSASMAPSFFFNSDKSLAAAMNEASWAVAAIGEQKTTQWLVGLAQRLSPDSAQSYEAMFAAWGGDVRERSLDLHTGQVRPREITLETEGGPGLFRSVLPHTDPTVYARVDYLEANKNLTAEERAAWQAVLKNLPVVFAFSPMNLLHYRVAFQPGQVRTVSVNYKQYAYLDTGSPHSYQIAYVVHPASLWDVFGPIQLTVTVPEGVKPLASSPLTKVPQALSNVANAAATAPGSKLDSYAATLHEKTGELFIGINVEEWKRAMAPKLSATPVPAQNAVR